ncbi:unnamed protein product [Pleuronectes platessa]|uniref:Uncharacterized protein n=1 Tax=Pleuronectes platessa TaxID=8262 RepID=A0A9N7VYS3_PLEPL|nr:unnamed protein product [Pleuronectes platessa]
MILEADVTLEGYGTPRQQGSLRRPFPGGNLIDFLCQTHNSNTKFRSTQCSSLAVHWFTVTDQNSLIVQVSEVRSRIPSKQKDDVHSVEVQEESAPIRSSADLRCNHQNHRSPA